ncbi:MAG: hypothetical protein U5L96_08890 [Owenweeksia sp.]|nr:hypothetical protein [Owenweeksia sp.]
MQADFQRIGLGTVQLGMSYGIANKTGKPDEEESRSIIYKAEMLGIDLLDTASAYGDSETVIGNTADGQFNVVSKWIDDPQKELEQSLGRLKVSQLYAWLAHVRNFFLLTLTCGRKCKTSKRLIRFKKLVFQSISLMNCKNFSIEILFLHWCSFPSMLWTIALKAG